MASSETIIVNMENQGFAPEFMSAFKKTYAKGPNFNTNDFVLSYPCGGGAICGSIFDSSREEVISFPDDYIGASDVEKFAVKFSKASNHICFWGESAYTNDVYKNACYIYDGQVLILKEK